MKLEIYEPHKLGYVIMEPYEWEYNGRYPAVGRFLENRPEFYNYDGGREDGVTYSITEEVVDEEEYYRFVTSKLQKLGVWGTKIVEE